MAWLSNIIDKINESFTDKDKKNIAIGLISFICVIYIRSIFQGDTLEKDIAVAISSISLIVFATESLIYERNFSYFCKCMSLPTALNAFIIFRENDLISDNSFSICTKVTLFAIVFLCISYKFESYETYEAYLDYLDDEEEDEEEDEYEDEEDEENEENENLCINCNNFISIEKRIAVAKDQNIQLQKEISELNNERESIEKQNAEMERQNEEIAKENVAIKDECESLKSNIAELLLQVEKENTTKREISKIRRTRNRRTKAQIEEDNRIEREKVLNDALIEKLNGGDTIESVINAVENFRLNDAVKQHVVDNEAHIDDNTHIDNDVNVDDIQITYTEGDSGSIDTDIHESMYPSDISDIYDDDDDTDDLVDIDDVHNTDIY